MKEYFTGDTYTTPEETRQSILDLIFFRSRWGLYLKFAVAVLASRKKALAGGFDDSAWADASDRVKRIVESCGGRFEFTGLDVLCNLKKPVVFVANHMSTLETLILPVLTVPFLKVTFVVKEKLVGGPMFGPIMRAVNPITVTRSEPRKDLVAVLEEGTSRLADGCSIIVFPQGTRREVFRREQFNSLGVKLALHADADIVPVAIKTDFWTNGKYLKGFGKLERSRPIHISFGPIISPQGRGKEAHQQSVDFVSGKLAEWGAEVERQS